MEQTVLSVFLHASTLCSQQKLLRSLYFLLSAFLLRRSHGDRVSGNAQKKLPVFY